MSVNDQAVWDAYNLLLTGPDTERIRKLLARHELFRKSLEVPGDIVECGVFKGAGLMLWLKLLHVFAPGSAKKVVGLDLFSEFPTSGDPVEDERVKSFVEESGFQGVSTASLLRAVEGTGMDARRCVLVGGDIQETAPAYVAANPGFRISLLHMDLDLMKPTRAALEAFWPRVVRGGLVVFDEYAVGDWTESEGVDRFFEGLPVRLQSLPWARTPTAFLVKE